MSGQTTIRIGTENLLFHPPTQVAGSELISQLTEHGADPELIRTSGLVGSEAGTMFADFTGTCEAETRLVEEAKRIAETLAIPGLRCTATAPTR